MALARALVNRPKVLLLDEPLGALDLKLREQMQVELKALQQQLGITFVFVTHDQGEALSMADRVAIFNEGRLVQVGAPRDIYERPQTRFVADFVGSSNVLDPDFSAAHGGNHGWTSLRPENIRIGPRGIRMPGGAASTARSGRRRYRRPVSGRDHARRAWTSTGPSIGVAVPASDSWRAGRAVTLSWRPSAARAGGA